MCRVRSFPARAEAVGSTDRNRPPSHSTINVRQGLVAAPQCIISRAIDRAAPARLEQAYELTSFIVTVIDREAIDKVALKFEALGIDVARMMQRTGMIGCRGPGHLLSAIIALQSVEHVRGEQEFQLPPLNESVPQ